MSLIGRHRFTRRSRAALEGASAEAFAFACRPRNGESAGGRVRLRDLDALPRSSLRRRPRKPGPDRPAIEISARWIIAGASALSCFLNVRTAISRRRVAGDGLVFLAATANQCSTKGSNQHPVLQ